MRRLAYSGALMLGLVAAAGLTIGMMQSSAAEGQMARVPVPAMRETVGGDTETAIFAGGCFWGVQGVFSHVKGVISATSGYAGGAALTAHYDIVSTGTTGHAEAVRVVFDPRQVNYADLLRIFFAVVADPTTRDRQGPDEGTQYRTALFPLSDDQAKVAHAYIAQIEADHLFSNPIVTQIEPGRSFYPAEAYHQDFLAQHPDNPYIVANDRPKVEALAEHLPQFWRADRASPTD